MVGLWFVCAEAAEVTDLPPEMGLVAGLAYDGSALMGGLVEDGLLVGERRIGRHDLGVQAEFAPVDGVAFSLGLQTTPSYRLDYPNSRTMVVEPVSGSGSYLSGDLVAEPPTLRAGGIDGLWLGVAASPFAERYDPSQRATSRLDVAIRTPSKNRNLWTANDNGKRGPAPGGTAIRLAAAFSADRGVGNPWLRAEWLRESKVEIDVRDETGQVWAKDLTLQPASTFVADTGVEIVALEDAELGSRYAVDLWLGVGYRSWEDVASGVYLPNVLDGPRSIPVTTGDTVLGRAGAAFDAHVQDVLRMRVGLTFDYAMPYVLEHVYAVTTSANTFQVGWNVEVSGVGSFARE